MAKATIKTYKNSKAITLSLNKITKGELLSIYNALAKHAETSPVAGDVQAYVKNAIVTDCPSLLNYV